MADNAYFGLCWYGALCSLPCILLACPMAPCAHPSLQQQANHEAKSTMNRFALWCSNPVGGVEPWPAGLKCRGCVYQLYGSSNVMSPCSSIKSRCAASCTSEQVMYELKQGVLPGTEGSNMPTGLITDTETHVTPPPPAVPPPGVAAAAVHDVVVCLRTA